MNSDGTIPALLDNSAWTIESGLRSSKGNDIRDSARSHAAALSTFEPGSGVLICIADPIESLAVAMGAWWAGMRVAFERADSPLSTELQLSAVAASVHIVDRVNSRTPTGLAASGVVEVSHFDLNGSPVGWGPRCSPNDPALDAITSGTTGVPKCVVFTHAAIINNAVALASAMDLRREDRVWTCLPHGLSGVLCTVTLAAGCHSATAVLSEQRSIGNAIRSLATDSPTVVYGVPEIYEALAAALPLGNDALRHVRLWLSSSGVLSPTLGNRMKERWGADIRSFYCGTEFGTATFNDSADSEIVRSSVGRAISGVSIDIGTEDAQAGGRITVRGDLVGCGYRTPDGLEPFPVDGVETTDLGLIDEHGFLFLLGRVGGTIHSGAEVIDPPFVERVVASIDGVSSCEVVPMNHSLFGQVIEARVVRSGDVELTERDVILGCRERGLQGRWVPRRVTWVEPSPAGQQG